MRVVLCDVGGVHVGNQNYPITCIDVVNTPIFDLALTKKLPIDRSTAILVGDTVLHNIEVINQGTVASLMSGQSNPGSFVMHSWGGKWGL